MSNTIIIKTEKAPAPIGPYNQAILAGNTLYVSGQIALDTQTGEMLNDTIEQEIKTVMNHIVCILSEAGFSLNNVVKCSIFLKDFNDFGLVNQIYGSFFTSSAPARETVEVSRLPKDARVEISCVAVK